MASKAISPRVFRGGRVLAPDSKWTGEEPEWKGWETWSTEKFFTTKSRMLNFYGYYLSEGDLKPQVAAYMKDGGYSASDIDAIRNSKNVMASTVGKLIRAIDQGMPELHPKAQEHFDKLRFSDPENPPVARNDRDIIREEISKTLRFLQTSEKNIKPIIEIKASAPTPSAQDRLRLKVDKEIISHLDEMLDRWTRDAHMTRVDGLSMVSFIRDGNIPPLGCKPIIDWIERQRDEYKGALEGTCDQLMEGYEYLSKPALKNRITLLEGMLGDVLKHSSGSAKASPKSREKKVKDAHKQIARLQYQRQCDEYSIKSPDPIGIPAARRVYVFNTKYRTLGVYIAGGAAGFEVRGTSLKNFDPALSYITTLRKPNEVLPIIISSMPAHIDKVLDSRKCKKRKPNGRLNLQTVIIRVIGNKI